MRTLLIPIAFLAVYATVMLVFGLVVTSALPPAGTIAPSPAVTMPADTAFDDFEDEFSDHSPADHAGGFASGILIN